VKRLVVAIVACVAAVGQAASVSYQPLSFGGEAGNGVFAVDVDGDGSRDLIALGRGRISIYRGRRGKVPPYPTTPETVTTGSKAFFADVADVHPAPGKELVVLTPNGVSCHVQANGKYDPTPKPVLQCDTVVSLPLLRGALTRVAWATVDVLPWNFAFDADGDGREDLLVAHGGGTNLYLQTAPGKFAKPITLPLFPIVYHSGATDLKADGLSDQKATPVRLELLMRKIERRDVNGDGKLDLACGDVWFAQRHAGGFDPVPATVPGGAQVVPSRQVVDINGDGRMDRIAEENSLDDPFNILTRVRYFLADANGTVPPSPTGTITGQNILVHTALPVHDFDGDKALDFAMLRTDITATDVGKWVRQSFGEIDGDLNIYLFDRSRNRYPRRPAYTKKIRMRFKVDLQDVMIGGVWERYLGSMMRFEGDYNGDGRLDLLVREKTDMIAIYFNTGKRRGMFPRRPDVVLDDLPTFSGIDIDDLNGDGASDIVLSSTRSAFGPSFGRSDVIAVYISQRK